MSRFIALLALIIFSVTICLGLENKKDTIKFENKIHKFDTTAVDSKAISYEFVFENRGKAPLVILKSEVSCKCVKIKYDKTPILPGKKGTIKVIFNPKGMSKGLFTRNIKIYSNAQNKREILTVMGVVK